MYQSRMAFTAANNSAKAKRALQGQIPNVETEYYSGDKVYFRKLNTQRWCGPATVLGKDGKVVFLRQEGSIFRVHVTKVVLKSRADKSVVSVGGKIIREETSSNSEESEKYTIEQTGREGSVKKEQIVVSDSDSKDRFCPKESGEVSNEPSAEQVEVSSGNETSMEESGIVETSGEQVNSGSVDDENRDTSVLDEFQSASSSDENQDWVDVAVKRNNVLDLKSEDVIRYKSADHTNDNRYVAKSKCNWTWMETIFCKEGKQQRLELSERTRR